jgi:hypothetical protein
LAHSVRHLVEFGPALGFPHSSKVTSSRYPQMRELRTQSGGMDLSPKLRHTVKSQNTENGNLRPRCLAWVALGVKECINEAPSSCHSLHSSVLRFG